jgi:hypothetical protein
MFPSRHCKGELKMSFTADSLKQSKFAWIDEVIQEENVNGKDHVNLKYYRGGRDFTEKTYTKNVSKELRKKWDELKEIYGARGFTFYESHDGYGDWPNVEYTHSLTIHWKN